MIASHRLGDLLKPMALKACAMAGAQVIEWTGDKPSATPEPLALVSALPPGDRRISDELVGLMTQTWPGLPLLLLCSDELVRPAVSVQGGRVTLLGPPLTEDRVASRLRILMADRRSSSLASLVKGGHVAVREQSTRQAYVGLVGSAGAEALEPSAGLPYLDFADDRGLSTVLTVSPQLDAIQSMRAVEVSGREERDEEKERTLAGALGPAAALLQLTAHNEWLIYWPDPAAGVLLCSPLRLPQVYDLSGSLARSETSLVRIQAASGDVVVGLWGSALPLPRAKVAEAALSGGPKVLDLLVQHLSAQPTLAAGAVVEVR